MYGDGKTAEHPRDAQQFMNEVLADMDKGVARFNAARRLLENHSSTDASKTAAIGYCFGGGVVLHMARIGSDLDAVASFHGSLGTKTPAKEGAVKARILVCHGEADTLVPEEQVQAFKQEMDAAKATWEFVSYPGAKHGFTNPMADKKAEEFDMPLGYDPVADDESWQELMGLLDSTWR